MFKLIFKLKKRPTMVVKAKKANCNAYKGNLQVNKADSNTNKATYKSYKSN